MKGKKKVRNDRKKLKRLPPLPPLLKQHIKRKKILVSLSVIKSFSAKGIEIKYNKPGEPVFLGVTINKNQKKKTKNL